MKFNLKKLEQKKGIYLITESVYVPLPPGLLSHVNQQTGKIMRTHP